MSKTQTPLVRLSSTSKFYGPTAALSDVDFDCHAGEIHAILGENGAGKSTLMKLIAGVIEPSEGSIFVDGKEQKLSSPRAAMDLGLICMFQELSLVPDLTVRDNLLLGAPGIGLGRLKADGLERARSILDQIDGASISFQALVADLTLAERQQVEFAKALSRAPRLLILDEATSALNASVVEKVFEIVRQERDNGTGVLFISHRFHEIEALADTISVFRNGKHIDTFANGAYDYPAIIDKMVGQSFDELFPPKPEPNPSAQAVLRLENFGWDGEIHDVSLSLRAGQITGLGGLDGQGQMLVLQGLFGLLKQTDGAVTMDGKSLDLGSPKDAKAPDVGIALVPEDRKTEGLILAQSIRQNMELAATSRSGDDAPGEGSFQAFIEALELKCRSLDQPVEDLSGGNQQKVALIKWLVLSPKCLLLADPTRGIDVKTKTQIYALLRKLADDGVAVLLLSTDYEELLHLCDEVHIFYAGRVVNRLSGDDLTAENIIASSLNLGLTQTMEDAA
ncbi:sugar ABC transporter ATP-binding protein [Ahrensia marina]|uniref:sugar ABC transporter ATP-binding protein n=1 Tax=Ahrensia marina TaxID=1514904 RepID=UPI0035CEB669